MGGDKKLETMSEEIKLLKGELKQSLASVRDYLLNMELPTSEFSTILEALDGGEGQNVAMTGSLGKPQDFRPTEEIREEFSEAEPEMLSEDDNLIDVEKPSTDRSDTLTEYSLTGEDESLNPKESIPAGNKPSEDSQPDFPDELEETVAPESELPREENLPMDFEKTSTEPSQTTPKVNMLANLITWVTKVKREIGYDQIPTLLEVYGISGHLSAELKEVIIHLAEITAEKPEVANDPEVWNQAMLSLHGILTGGDAPLHPIVPFLAEVSSEVPPIEEEKPKEAPFKLKLVFPDGDGKDKEFCINLTPEEDNSNSSASKRKK